MSINTLTNLEQEIQRQKKAHADRIAKLKKKAEVEKNRIDAKVLLLLEDTYPELYGQLKREANTALELERHRRSTRAKSATQSNDASCEALEVQGQDTAVQEDMSW